MGPTACWLRADLVTYHGITVGISCSMHYCLHRGQCFWNILKPHEVTCMLMDARLCSRSVLLNTVIGANQQCGGMVGPLLCKGLTGSNKRALTRMDVLFSEHHNCVAGLLSVTCSLYSLVCNALQWICRCTAEVTI